MKQKIKVLQIMPAPVDGARMPVLRIAHALGNTLTVAPALALALVEYHFDGEVTQEVELVTLDEGYLRISNTAGDGVNDLVISPGQKPVVDWKDGNGRPWLDAYLEEPPTPWDSVVTPAEVVST